MATKGGHIDFMFLDPPSHPAAGSDAVIPIVNENRFLEIGLKIQNTYR